ncbi:hypothetical protein [Deinococcus sp.]|uniref:hypothetical protein n=1 Tax=Deinococcus sp. TaxID=47478 RepID=UPI003B5B86BB
MAKYSRARTRVDFYTLSGESKSASQASWERLETPEILDLERRVAYLESLAADLEKCGGRAWQNAKRDLFFTLKDLERVRSMAQRAGDHLK